MKRGNLISKTSSYQIGQFHLAIKMATMFEDVLQ